MEELARIINKKIKESSIYKEYLFYKEKLGEDVEVLAIRNKLLELKELICKNKEDSLVEEYYKLETCYKKNSVVSSFFKSEEEMKKMLENIVDILSLN